MKKKPHAEFDDAYYRQFGTPGAHLLTIDNMESVNNKKNRVHQITSGY